MKRNQLIFAALLVTGLLAPIAATAEPNIVTNRLALSARFGLNISAKFSGTSPLAVPASPRTTPDGDLYNYDNGYVYPDVSGSGDGLTWYWGYDDSSAQVDAGANTILMSRATSASTLRSPELDDDPSPGAELVYSRYLGTKGDFHFGFEAAANYLNIGMRDRGGYSVPGTTITDAFPYSPGTTPPGATPGSPYQGTFDGPGFVIGTTPVSSTTAAATVAGVSGRRELDADLFGGRLGPYCEYYFNDDVSMTLSGGLAVGWVCASVSWNETITFANGTALPDRGRDDDGDLLWGGYVAANVYWRFSERWSAAAGAQFQSLGTYDEKFGTRKVELDLSKSFFFTVGLSYSF